MLGLCPIGIAVIWVAGVAMFRNYPLTTLNWLLLIAFAFAMDVIGKRIWKRRPLPPLPEGARAIPLSALAAIAIAFVAAIVSGILEWFATDYFPTDISWGMRTLWHSACAFAASYCAYLQRLLKVLPA